MRLDHVRGGDHKLHQRPGDHDRQRNRVPKRAGPPQRPARRPSPPAHTQRRERIQAQCRETSEDAEFMTRVRMLARTPTVPSRGGRVPQANRLQPAAPIIAATSRTFETRRQPIGDARASTPVPKPDVGDRSADDGAVHKVSDGVIPTERRRNLLSGLRRTSCPRHRRPAMRRRQGLGLGSQGSPGAYAVAGRRRIQQRRRSR